MYEGLILGWEDYPLSFIQEGGLTDQLQMSLWDHSVLKKLETFFFIFYFPLFLKKNIFFFLFSFFCIPVFPLFTEYSKWKNKEESCAKVWG